ncbi:hypothetical protein M3J09_001326 [Ascochyta lentis]
MGGCGYSKAFMVVIAYISGFKHTETSRQICDPASSVKM